MRICKDNKDDPHYDQRPRRVWCKDQEVLEPWSVADEFRRVIILEDGKVLNGAVFIEKLKDSGESATAFEPAAPNTGFSGTSVSTPDKQDGEAAAPTVVAKPPAVSHKFTRNR